MSFSGRNALITGASRGIGRGCAEELGKAGANVAINYHSHSGEADEVASAVRLGGGRAITLQGDVSNRERVEEMVAQTAAEFGSLDLFVSNAVYSDRQLMLGSDLDGFRRTIDVGMWGAFYGVRAAAMQMVKQGKGGSIVVISSPHAVIPLISFIPDGSIHRASGNFIPRSSWPLERQRFRGSDLADRMKLARR